MSTPIPDVNEKQDGQKLAPTTIASDSMWGAKVYRGERSIGSITRLFINKETGAVDCFEIAQRIGRPPLFVR